MKRLMPRVLVILTTLLCLGVGGYAAQVRWAKHAADMDWPMVGYCDEGELLKSFPWLPAQRRESRRQKKEKGIPGGNDRDTNISITYLSRWKEAPWYGEFSGGRWIPRRAYYEQLLSHWRGKMDLGNSTRRWEEWFRAHPESVWEGRADF